MSFKNWDKCCALVTGASGAIGASICRQLVKTGLTVFGCGRNIERIQALSKDEEVVKGPGSLKAIKCDFKYFNEVMDLMETIRDRHGELQVLVNNAGVVQDSPLTYGEPCDWMDMIKVNVLSSMLCSREALNMMREMMVEDGHIINIGSSSGFKIPEQPATQITGFGIYYGTQAMARTLSESLRQEIKASQLTVRVSTISPGPVNTQFSKQFYGRSPEAPYGFRCKESLSAEDVAEALMFILRTPAHVNIKDIVMEPMALD